MGLGSFCERTKIIKYIGCRLRKEEHIGVLKLVGQRRALVLASQLCFLIFSLF